MARSLVTSRGVWCSSLPPDSCPDSDSLTKCTSNVVRARQSTRRQCTHDTVTRTPTHKIKPRSYGTGIHRPAPRETRPGWMTVGCGPGRPPVIDFSYRTPRNGVSPRRARRLRRTPRGAACTRPHARGTRVAVSVCEHASPVRWPTLAYVVRSRSRPW